MASGLWVWTGGWVSGAAVAALLFGCGGSSSASHVAGDSGVSGGDSGQHGDGEVSGDAPHIRPKGRSDAAVDGPKIEHIDAGYPAPFPAVPQVQNGSTGTSGVLANPKIIAIFFSNDDMAAVTKYEAFYSGIGATAYWKALSEYGIGAATTTNIILTEAAPATIDDSPDSAGDNTALENWLLSKITSMELPATDNNTEYVINYPASTSITSDGASCTDWDGYHLDVADSQNHLVAYAVVPRCAAQMPFNLDQTFTTTASHEVVEAATDPWPDYVAGWVQVDNADLFFDEANSGSEIGDMCQDDPEAYYQFSEFAYTIQRFWSNAAAKAGHDPCVPEIPGTTFFNAVPEVHDQISFPYNDNTVQTDGVKIPVGGSATITLDLYSDAKTEPWTVQMFDYNWFFYGTSTSMSDALLSFDAASGSGINGNNGDRIPVTITVRSAGNMSANGEVNNTELFVIQVTQGSGMTAPVHFWYGLVGQ